MTIEISFPDGTTKQYPRWTKVAEILHDLPENRDALLVTAALINNEVVSLSYKVDINSSVRPISLSCREGVNIY
ncbi:MAG TPA: hypothetical protein ENN69_00390, partial [Spirochaetia bacterium]|nr:hypothetical protein [Spirochaetia bacterium]